MKVLIKDTDSKRYLSADGRWVRTADDAQDFHSLLPAYNFAKLKTSGHFQVILYCPDDNFCTTIIEGVGTAHSGAAEAHKSIKLTITFVSEAQSAAPFVSIPAANHTGTQNYDSPASRFFLN